MGSSAAKPYSRSELSCGLASGVAILLAFSLASSARAEADGPDHFDIRDVEPAASITLRAEPDSESAGVSEVPGAATCLRNLLCQGGLTLQEFTTLSPDERASIESGRPRWCRVAFEGHEGWLPGRNLREARGPCPAASTASDPSAPPSLEEAENASIVGVPDGPITLEDGVWLGEPFVPGGASRPRLTMIRAVDLTGDLDGDGRAERVILLLQSGGGSGTFSYIAVLARGRGGVTNPGSALLGDRVWILDAEIREQRIELEVVQAGPDDPVCCPSQIARRSWTLRAAGLEEGPATIVGTAPPRELQDGETNR